MDYQALEESVNTKSYIPGQCNIGPEEVTRRMRLGYIGLALMIVFIFLAELYSIPQIWKLGLFVPTVYALSGFIQARHKFCFLFGFLGLFSFTGNRSRIQDPTQLSKDRSTALRIVGQVFLGTSIITMLYYFLS